MSKWSWYLLLYSIERVAGGEVFLSMLLLWTGLITPTPAWWAYQFFFIGVAVFTGIPASIIALSATANGGERERS